MNRVLLRFEKFSRRFNRWMLFIDLDFLATQNNPREIDEACSGICNDWMREEPGSQFRFSTEFTTIA